MQITGRELMTPDEVRILDNRNALLFIRGFPAVMDDKYEIKDHQTTGKHRMAAIRLISTGIDSQWHSLCRGV